MVLNNSLFFHFNVWHGMCQLLLLMLLPLLNSISSSAWHLAINFLSNSTIFQMILLMSVLQSCECWPICQADTNTRTRCAMCVHVYMHAMATVFFLLFKKQQQQQHQLLESTRINDAIVIMLPLLLNAFSWCLCVFVFYILFVLIIIVASHRYSNHNAISEMNICVYV